MLWTYSMQYGFMLLTLWKKKCSGWWHRPVWHRIYGSYQVQRVEEEMKQLRRTWVLYVFLQFGLQGAQWQIHSEKVMMGNWWPWWTWKVRSCDFSPRGWRPASFSAGYRWTLLQRAAWLAGSACPLWTTRLQSYRPDHHTAHRLHFKDRAHNFTCCLIINFHLQ